MIGMSPLNCIACGVELTNIMEDRGHQPSGGLSFHSYGHYGTVFFDPMDESCVQIAVCDKCLVSAERKGWVAYTKEMHRPSVSELDYMDRLIAGAGDEDMEIVDGPAW